jgi:hypothetical protein
LSNNNFELSGIKMIDLFRSISALLDELVQLFLLTIQTIATLKLTRCMYKIELSKKHTIDSINLTDLTSEGS